MTRTLATKRYAVPINGMLLRRTPEALKRILDATAGLWRGKKIDPLRYQRAMRKRYETIR